MVLVAGHSRSCEADWDWEHLTDRPEWRCPVGARRLSPFCLLCVCGRASSLSGPSASHISQSAASRARPQTETARGPITAIDAAGWSWSWRCGWGARKFYPGPGIHQEIEPGKCMPDAGRYFKKKGRGRRTKPRMGLTPEGTGEVTVLARLPVVTVDWALFASLRPQHRIPSFSFCDHGGAYQKNCRRIQGRGRPYLRPSSASSPVASEPP